MLDQQDGQPALAIELASGSRPCGRSRSAAAPPSPRRAAGASARWRARARPRAACGRAASAPTAAAGACRTDRAAAAPRCACARASSTSVACSSAPTMTLSSTVSAGNGRTIWKVRPMPRRQTSSGGSPSMRSPGKCDAPGVRREHAGDQVEQRGLAGAVRADHGEDLAPATSKLTSSTATQAAKALARRRRPPGARSSQLLRRGRAGARATARCRRGRTITTSSRQTP